MGALDWHKYEGPVLFDETFKSMSKDKKIHQVARWLRAIRDLTGRQIIFATHMGDIFGKISDKILYVQNDFGKSSVREIEFDELAVLQLDDEEEDEG
jgi:energy-coupling factor transporter ATP-binding protein EcfA2